MVLMHAFPIQAEALFAKTIYPGCHFSCRLVKSTARILYPFISSPNISRTCQEIRIPYIPISTVFLRINHIFVEPTAPRRTRGHVTVRPGSHCKDFGVRNNIESECLWDLLDYPLDPGANFPPSINAHVMVAFGSMAGLSTTTTSELALLRGYHPTEIRFRRHC